MTRIADWLGWGQLSYLEQLSVVRSVVIGGMSGLGVAVLFGWSPRPPTDKARAKKKKPAKRRKKGRR